MANGEGALVAQQRAAVEIPYQNLSLGLQESQNALGAFYMGTQINKQQAAMRAAMDKLRMENEKLAFQDKWHSEALEQRMQAQDVMNQIRMENANRQWMALNERWNAYKQTRDADADLSEHILSSGLKPGDVGYPDVVLEAKHLYPYSSLKLDQFMRQHNSARDDHEKMVEQKQATILKKFGQDWAGVGNWSNARLLRDPESESLRTYETEQGTPAPIDQRFKKDPTTGKAYTFKTDPKGNYIESDQLAVPVPGKDATGATIWSKFLVPKKEMLKLQQQMKALDEESKTIPPPQSVPSRPGAIRIYNEGDYNALQHGDKYIWVDPDTGQQSLRTKP